MTINDRRSRWWFSVGQVTNQYLKQWWPCSYMHRWVTALQWVVNVSKTQWSYCVIKGNALQMNYHFICFVLVTLRNDRNSKQDINSQITVFVQKLAGANYEENNIPHYCPLWGESIDDQCFGAFPKHQCSAPLALYEGNPSVIGGFP